MICDVLGIPKRTWGSNRNPFRVVKGCAPGSLRKQQLSSPTSSRSSNSSLNIVPDDPEHSISGHSLGSTGPSSASKDWKIENVWISMLRKMDKWFYEFTYQRNRNIAQKSFTDYFVSVALSWHKKEHKEIKLLFMYGLHPLLKLA